MTVKFVKDIRDLWGLTSYGLAKWLGVPPQSVDNSIRKAKSINIQTLAKLMFIAELAKLSPRKIIDMIYKEYLDELDQEVLRRGRPRE